MLEVRLIGPEWKPVHWRDLEAGFERDLVQLIGLWTRRLADEAGRRAPADKGQLRRSITNRVVRMAGEIVGLVGTNVPHAPYREFGTGIYSTFPGAPKRPIVPKNAKALKIPLKGNLKSGRFSSVAAAAAGGAQAVDHQGKHVVRGSIFRMSVKGTKPTPFLMGLLEEFGPQIEADVRRLAERHGFT